MATAILINIQNKILNTMAVNPYRHFDRTSLNHSNATYGYFRSKHKDAKIFENRLNPVILVFTI